MAADLAPIHLNEALTTNVAEVAFEPGSARDPVSQPTTSGVTTRIGKHDAFPGETVLWVIGTIEDDLIKVRLSGNNRVSVTANGEHFNAVAKVRDIDRLLVVGRRGDDVIHVDDRLPITAVLNGGLGNDILVGGSKADVLKGGNGHDIIIGRGGNDKVLGGDGSDMIIGGMSAHDDKLGALARRLSIWSSGRPLTDRIEVLKSYRTSAALMDDGHVDNVSDLTFDDWYVDKPAPMADAPAEVIKNTWYFEGNRQPLKFGQDGDQFVAGNWNGLGSVPTVVRPGEDGVLHWLSDQNFDGVADRDVKFGLPGSQALVGDWDGDGRDNIGAVRTGYNGELIWFLDTNWDQSAEITYSFGRAGDIPVVGNWDGVGGDDIGIVRRLFNGQWGWQLDTDHDGSADETLTYGVIDSVPVVGDWNGDGVDDISVRRPAEYFRALWILDTNRDGISERFYVGYDRSAPVAGNWGGDPPLTPPPCQICPKPGPPEVTIEWNGGDIQNGGTIDLGSAPSGSTPRRETFTVKNDGDVDLKLEQVSISGSDSSTFRLYRKLNRLTLRPGRSTTFEIEMLTGKVGTFNADIRFGTNDADENPFNFSIAGQVTNAPSKEPDIDIDGVARGQTVVFDSAEQSGAAVKKTFAIRNRGTADLIVQIVRDVSYPFEVISQPARSLRPGESTTLSIVLHTNKLGSYSSTIRVYNNDGGESPYQFQVQGTVTPRSKPEVDIEGIVDGQSDPISFGTVVPGAMSIKQFKVRNLGSATLTLGQPRISGNGFRVVQGLPSSLKPNESAVFSISMQTSVAGNHSAVVRFTSNDADESTYDFKVTGTVKEVTVTPPPKSRYGSVVNFKTVKNAAGRSIVVKQVQVYGAAGNNHRLFVDYLDASGVPLRTDVRLGNHEVFGDQVAFQAESLSNGNFVVAWRNTNATTSGGIHYAVVTPFGTTVGRNDRTANIGFSPQHQLVSLSRSGSGFSILWKDYATGKTWRRDFNVLGTAVSGEIRV